MQLKRKTLWIALLILVLGAGVGAAAVKKKGTPAPAVAAAAPAALEFLPSDLAEVRPRALRQTLALSGSLRAVNQAAVKAKVAGEAREVLVREGEAVSAGQVLVRIDTAEYRARLDQARGALEAARGQLAIAAKSRDNNQALLAKGFISKNAFDNAASQYDIAVANVNSAKGALDVAQKALNDAVVKAPISGLVASRSVQPGEKVAIDSRLLDVVDLRQMEMEVAVPAADIVNVALGQEMLVKVEGLPQPLSGKVARINPSTQTGSRSIMVYVQIDNPQGVLRVGMFGEAQLTMSRKDGVLSVPQAAIQGDAAAPFVYAVENRVLVQKPVTLGMRGSDGDVAAVEIVKGLADGAQIVRNNLGPLRPGSPVRIVGGASRAEPPGNGSVAER